MTRFEKKCLVGAAGMHGLLLIVLFASSAFQGEPPKQQSFAPINWIPLKTSDTASLMAGNPNATPPSVKAPTPNPPAPAAQPAPEKPQPQPEKPQPKSEPAPEKVEVKPTKQTKHDIEPDPEPIISSKSDSRPIRPIHKSRSPKEIKVDLGSTAKVKPRKPTRSTSSDDSEAKAAAAAAAAQRRTANEISQAFSGLASAISKGTSKATVIDLPGQGGGAAFADYRSVLFSAYYNAWTTPDNVENDLAAVEVKVVVARNGSIISATITKKSSESAVNRSVQRALEAVSKLPPFPEGATDDQRSFRLIFNLKAKQSLG